MKKIIAIALCLTALGVTNASSQTVNDIPISEINVDYIQIVGTSKMMSNRLTIQLDFGQENKLFSSKNTQLKDGDGKVLTFHSMIDALNFLSAYGYDFLTAYAFDNDGQNTYHYMLKKRR